VKRFLFGIAAIALLGLTVQVSFAQEGKTPKKKTEGEAAPAAEGETKPAGEAAPEAKGEKKPDAPEGEFHKVRFGTDGFGDIFYADGTRFQIDQSSEIAIFVPRISRKTSRFFALLAGSARITIQKNPVLVKLPFGDAKLWGEGSVAALTLSRDEASGQVSLNVANPAPKSALHILLAGKQMQVGAGKTLLISAGALTNIAKGGEVVIPPGEKPANQTDTFHYHVGAEGTASIRFPFNQRILAGQKSDFILALDRQDTDVRGLLEMKGGFFKARLQGKYFRLKTPSNRIIINGASFWARIDPSGEWDRIQHAAGVAITLESLKVDGFRIQVPLKGGADLIHPKDSRVVLLSVHRGLPPSRTIVIQYGGRIFELPPEGALKPEAETKGHPEKTGSVLFEQGDFTIMIYRDGNPLSYRLSLIHI